MKKLRIESLYEPHFFNQTVHLSFEQHQETASKDFDVCLEEHLDEGTYFSDTLLDFIHHVFQLSPLSFSKQKEALVLLEKESEAVIQFYIQQPSESIERLFERVHKLFFYLIVFYGNREAIKYAAILWKRYIFNSKLQQDLTAIFYNISLLKMFSLSLYSAPNLNAVDKKKHVKQLKGAFLDALLGFKMTETIKLVKLRLQESLI